MGQGTLQPAQLDAESQQQDAKHNGIRADEPHDRKRSSNRIVKQRRAKQYRDNSTQRQQPFAADMFPTRQGASSAIE